MSFILIHPDGHCSFAKPSFAEVDRIKKNIKVLSVFNGDKLTMYQVANRLNVNFKWVRRTLERLEEQGVLRRTVVREGNFKVGYYEVIDGNRT